MDVDIPMNCCVRLLHLVPIATRRLSSVSHYADWAIHKFWEN